MYPHRRQPTLLQPGPWEERAVAAAGFFNEMKAEKCARDERTQINDDSLRQSREKLSDVLGGHE